MSEGIKIFIAALLLMVMLMATGAWVVINQPGQVITYDCRILMGSWHPDVPPAVLEQCRQLRMKKE